MAEEIVNAEIIDGAIVSRDYDVTELAKVDSVSYCSIKADSREKQALIFNASNNPQHKVADFINKTVNVTDVYAETLELVDEETGELEKAPRIVLIDDKGEGYETVSVGMFGSLKKLVAAFGEPTWEPPIPVVIEQQKVKNGSMLTMRAVY